MQEACCFRLYPGTESEVNITLLDYATTTRLNLESIDMQKRAIDAAPKSARRFQIPEDLTTTVHQGCMVVPTLQTVGELIVRQPQVRAGRPVAPPIKSAKEVRIALNRPCSDGSRSWVGVFTDLLQQKEGGIPDDWDFDTAMHWNCAFAVLVPVRDRLAIDSMVSRLRTGCVSPDTGGVCNGAEVNTDRIAEIGYIMRYCTVCLGAVSSRCRCARD